MKDSRCIFIVSYSIRSNVFIFTVIIKSLQSIRSPPFLKCTLHLVFRIWFLFSFSFFYVCVFSACIFPHTCYLVHKRNMNCLTIAKSPYIFQTINIFILVVFSTFLLILCRCCCYYSGILFFLAKEIKIERTVKSVDRVRVPS